MQRQHGRSLIELLCVVTIVAILTQGASGSWSQALAHYQARVATQGLLQAIRLARSSSITLRRVVTICPARDTQGCAGAWTAGILVFIDENADGVFNGRDQALQHLHPSAAGSSISWRAFRNRKWLQFTPLGQTAQQNGSFVYCPGNRDVRIARVVIVNKLGRSRLARDRNGDGVVEMASGKPVTC